MQQRENEIRTQRNVEVVRSEIIVCPKREKNEGGNPDGCDQARKIFFGDSQPEQSRIDQKEIDDPRDLHEHGSNSAKDPKRTPFVATRDGKQTDIEQRNVSEKSKLTVLSGGQKDRGQKAATNSANRDHERIQLHCEEKRRCRD